MNKTESFWCIKRKLFFDKIFFWCEGRVIVTRIKRKLFFDKTFFGARDVLASLASKESLKCCVYVYTNTQIYMTSFIANLETETLHNTDYRNVLYTSKTMQLVLMSLLPLEEIGAEIHHDKDQFIRVESGHGLAILNGRIFPLSDGVAVIVPTGTEHNIINVDRKLPLQIYTIYAPPEHAPKTRQPTKPK